MKYYKIQTEQQADKLSKDIYDLISPNSETLGTVRFFDWLKNEDGEIVACIPELPEFKQPERYTISKEINFETGEVTEVTIDNGIINKKDPASLLVGLEEVNYQYLLDNGFIKISSSPIE